MDFIFLFKMAAADDAAAIFVDMWLEFDAFCNVLPKMPFFRKVMGEQSGERTGDGWVEMVMVTAFKSRSGLIKNTCSLCNDIIRQNAGFGKGHLAAEFEDGGVSRG